MKGDFLASDSERQCLWASPMLLLVPAGLLLALVVLVLVLT